jgi:hypothetical protein|tara:strand:- start:97 stop:336 length:240 start_codon:yes stop_codon:yes gene_type:complete
MTIWLLLTILWALWLLFTITAPNKWHAIVVKENQFWLNRKLVSESFVEKMVKFETGLWFKLLLSFGLLSFIIGAVFESN